MQNVSILIFALLFSVSAFASGTYTAASCSYADVNDCINHGGAGTCSPGGSHTMVDGDTIKIPSGSCTWTSGITIPSGVGGTITGNGTPNSGASTTGAASSCTATAITDDISSGGSPVFLGQPTMASSTLRISCMKLLETASITADPPLMYQGTCNSSGCPSIREDNITFDASFQGGTSGSGSLHVTDGVFGVIDHETSGPFNCCSAVGVEFIDFNNASWLGVGSYGDNSWASADTFGTASVLYLENNLFGAATVISDTEAFTPNGNEGGGRIAVRFNTCNGCLSGAADHGTESNGRPRGGRQIEFYGNTFTCTNSSGGCQGGVPIRSGTVLMWGNVLNVSGGAWFNQYIAFNDYRTLQAFPPWGACDGGSVFDTNDAGNPLFSGRTISSVTGSNPYVITPSGTTPSWTLNQWQSGGADCATGSICSVHDSTINNGGLIASNTSNTVTVDAWTSTSYANGDSFVINHETVCLDQENRSGGTYYSGSTPSPSSAANQTLDPAYEFDDSGYDPVFGNVNSNAPQMIANRDWYTDNSAGTPHAQTSPTSPFSGASGVGFGTLANRPTSCTPVVGYWATDQGSWNASSNTYTGGYAQGELFTCTATNTWTASYTPYTYPHPLDSGGSNPTPAPSAIMMSDLWPEDWLSGALVQ